MTRTEDTETPPRRATAEGAVGRLGDWTGVRPGALLPILALPLLLGACSSLFFDDEELAPQRIQVQSQKAENPDFPNLASVPDQTPQPSSSAQRQELVQGLSGDRENAHYSDGPLTPESVAAESNAASELSYPPPPVLDSAGAGSTISRTAANAPAPPDAALDEPAMPPPPAGAPAASQAAQSQGGFGAPPPPDMTAAGEGTTALPSVPTPPAMPDQSAGAGGGSPTGLLQERAFQQQAAAAQRLQQMAAERRAFEAQARQQAIEQQWQGEQLIQQHQAQWRYPSTYQQQAAAQPTAAPYPAPNQGVTAAPIAQGQLVGLIYFGHGSARLDAHDRQVLQQLAALQQSEGRSLRVIGHASARAAAGDMAEHEAKNQAMSMRRAQAVAKALVSMGADRDRIAVDGAGDSQPVYHEFTPAGEAGNRRVEIFLE